MGFRTICSGNKTFLVCTLGRREKISYAQLDMFKNETYKEYFVIPDCTKNGATTKISFDISGLTSLSEYIKTRLEQEQYFKIISGIQKIASFCKSASLPFENLICNPKYMYYHNTYKKILMAFVPMQTPHSLSISIPECLLKIHKSAKDVVIRDGNYMSKYEDYLSRFSGKKSKVQTFSPDSLQHFFNENEAGKPVEEYKSMPESPSNIIYVNDSKFNIDNQIKTSQAVRREPEPEVSAPVSLNKPFEPAVHSVPADKPERVPDTSVHAEPQQAYNGGTFIPPQPNPTPAETPSNDYPPEEMFDAYLTDRNGRKIYIDNIPFTIGREAPKSLVIDEVTVSGKHAEIKKEYNFYYLVNWSRSNGTFLNEDFQNRITTSVQLKDGDRIYFYRTCYTFHMVKPAAESQHTVIVQPQQPVTQHTFIVAPTPSARPLAYIRRFSDNSTIKVMSYPFTDSSLNGVVFSFENLSNRTALFIENTSCYSLKLENVDIGVGMKVEIFSGCSLYINGEKYTFIIEN
ncbi:MAG: FHA domain-containing protein [Ruminococcus sp.]|nr:FHA domain-containing protein [Ruminococcus sp.]